MKSFKILLFTLILLIGNKTFAQVTDSDNEDETPKKVVPLEDTTVQSIDWDKLKEKLVFGGSVGLQFYYPYTLFIISPQVGYKVRESTIVGTGLQMFGISSKNDSYFQYGPDIFVRQHIINTFFTQLQFEYINFENYILPGKRIWNPGLLAGFGYGAYGYSVGLFYDVWQTKNSEYIYPGQVYIGGLPFFFRGQIFF